MGFIKTFFIILFPGTSIAGYFALKLGPELPIACRNLGRNIGMGYNYFKVILKVLAPETHAPAEMIDVLRKTNQQVYSPLEKLQKFAFFIIFL